MKDCIFCKIVAGSAPCHKIWENNTHLAFLSIFPNTEGFSVVVPKEHYGSYFADVPPQVFSGLMDASREVAKLLDATFKDASRTGLMLEGMGVDHLHAQLSPMHGTADGTWKLGEQANHTAHYKNYPGHISTHESAPAGHKDLALLAERIRAVSK